MYSTKCTQTYNLDLAINGPTHDFSNAMKLNQNITCSLYHFITLWLQASDAMLPRLMFWPSTRAGHDLVHYV